MKLHLVKGSKSASSRWVRTFLAEPQLKGRWGGRRSLAPSGGSPDPTATSTQLARLPRGAGLKAPRTPPPPRDFQARDFSTLPGDRGTVATLRPARDSENRRALPGSRTASVGLGGLEAEPRPGRSREPPRGRERAVPEPSAPAREGRRPAAATAACSACPRPGTRSRQVTPPAARGLPLPYPGSPAAAQVGVAGAGRGGERVCGGAGRGSWAEAGRGAGCWSPSFLARGPGGFPPARPGSRHPALRAFLAFPSPGVVSTTAFSPLWHLNCALAFWGAFVHSP